MGSITERLKTAPISRPVLLRVRGALDRVAYTVGFRQSEDALERAAQRYWRDESTARYANDGQWRGSGSFADDERWLAIGRTMLRRYRKMITAVGAPERVGRIVDWGAGGGANAVHFAALCDEYVGVDVAPASLAECRRQLAAEGFDNFRPVHIDVASPETAEDEVGTCDVFLCVYVYETLPSPEYGERVLRIAHRLLRPGGVAFLQIKYATDDWRTRPRRYGYSLHMVSMTTYRIEEFWELGQRCGFVPELVELEPWDPVVNDERYAYYLFRKPETGR